MVQVITGQDGIFIDYSELENELPALLSEAGTVKVKAHWLQGVEIQIELENPVKVNTGVGQRINHFTKHWKQDVMFLDLPRNNERVIYLRLTAGLSLPVMPEEPIGDYIRNRFRQMAKVIAQGRWEY